MISSVVLFALAPVAAFAAVFKAPDGPFKVQWTNHEVVDEGRPDPFNASHPRRLMISEFKPVPAAQCLATCRVPYMPTEIATIEDAILTDYLADIGWPSGALAELEMEVCCEVAEQTVPQRKPQTLLLGPGLNTTRLFYSATGQQLASLGYQILILDHPYETDVVLFPDGELIFGGRIGGTNESYELGLDIRAQDVSFILDTLKICNTVYIGHSFGGASALATILTELRVLSGVNLDGRLFGPVTKSGVPRPFLQWSANGHNSTTDESWASFAQAMDENHSDVWTKEISLDNSTHNSLSDFSLIGDITGLRDNELLVEYFFGPVLGERAMEVLKAYLGAFVEFTMGGEEGILAGESKEFPDVRFLRG